MLKGNLLEKHTKGYQVSSWSWSATEEGCAENSAACRVAGRPANAGWPALSSEQNRPEQFTANSLHITLA